MKRLAVLSACLALGLGCTHQEPVTRVPLRPEPPGAASGPGGTSAASPLDAFQVSRPEVVQSTRYFSAANAPRCPEVEISSVSGQKRKLTLAVPRMVTLIVFGTMDRESGKAALRHAGDLEKKYRRLGVRAAGVVEKTRWYQKAELFATDQDLRYPLYYDDLSALERMSRAVGAERRRAFPAVFIADRSMRLRFYRGRFDYVVSIPDIRRPRQEQISENAPKGETIEDYLKRILREQ